MNNAARGSKAHMVSGRENHRRTRRTVIVRSVFRPCLRSSLFVISLHRAGQNVKAALLKQNPELPGQTYLTESGQDPHTRSRDLPGEAERFWRVTHLLRDQAPRVRHHPHTPVSRQQQRRLRRVTLLALGVICVHLLRSRGHTARESEHRQACSHTCQPSS